MREERTGRLQRDLANIEARLSRLTDAYLDAAIDRDAFELRKIGLLGDRRAFLDKLEERDGEAPFGEAILEILGRGNTACFNYDAAFVDEKRRIVKELTSDLLAERKTLKITLRNEFEAIATWRIHQSSAPTRNRT